MERNLGDQQDNTPANGADSQRDHPADPGKQPNAVNPRQAIGPLDVVITDQAGVSQADHPNDPIEKDGRRFIGREHHMGD